jgi:hypothetical protein
MTLSPEREAEIRERARRMIFDKVTYASVQYAEDYSALLAELDRVRLEFREAMDNYHGENQHSTKIGDAISEAHDALDEMGAPVFGLHDIAARIVASAEQVRQQLVPLWEAVYEPGNVSDYLIGYANDEAPAKAAAASWFVAQQLDEVGRLVWAAQPHGGDFTAWFDLIHVDPEMGEVSTGITVRRRVPAAVVPAGGEVQ